MMEDNTLKYISIQLIDFLLVKQLFLANVQPKHQRRRRVSFTITYRRKFFCSVLSYQNALFLLSSSHNLSSLNKIRSSSQCCFAMPNSIQSLHKLLSNRTKSQISLNDCFLCLYPLLQCFKRPSNKLITDEQCQNCYSKSARPISMLISESFISFSTLCLCASTLNAKKVSQNIIK